MVMMEYPDFFKITHSHEDKRFDDLDKMLDNIKDNLNIIRDPSWDDDWIKDERQPEETS
jgi:hypothetical protein